MYVGGGIGYTAKAQGKSVGAFGSAGEAISAHPHSALWQHTVGLVVDGVAFTTAKVNQKLRGGDGAYESVGHVPSSLESQQSLGASPGKETEAESEGVGEVGSVHKDPCCAFLPDVISAVDP